MAKKPTVYTIGHSNLPINTFITDLERNGVKMVVDVRKLTGSNSFPQFDEDKLAASLKKAGIQYRIIRGLSGRRPKQKGANPATNAWWENQSFHNYADYALTQPFNTALALLERIAAKHVTTIMCAEAVPWRCHRRIIADHLIAQGYPVEDIGDRGVAAPHEVPAGAKFAKGTVTYPATSDGGSTEKEGAGH